MKTLKGQLEALSKEMVSMINKYFYKKDVQIAEMNSLEKAMELGYL